MDTRPLNSINRLFIEFSAQDQNLGDHSSLIVHALSMVYTPIFWFILEIFDERHVTGGAKISRGGFSKFLLPDIICTNFRINTWLQVCILK